MRFLGCIAIVLLTLPLGAQSTVSASDFSLTLERIGCLGECPDYKVTVQGDGLLQYLGRGYVHVEGSRSKKLSPVVVQKVIQRLLEEDFFNWEEKKYTCIDFPETHITVTLNGRQKQVMEGCNAPGNVLKLAKEIEKITGVGRWI